MSDEIVKDNEKIDISDIKDEERIDFNHPNTILEYCKEDILTIKKIMEESSHLMPEDEYDSDVNLRVQKLDINKIMAENTKKKNKVEKRIQRIDNNILLRGVDKLLHIKDKMDDTVMTGSEIKRMYDENIDAVVADMRKDAENMMRNIQTNDDINIKVKPVLDRLRRKIALGYVDKQYFEDNFIVTLEQKQDLSEQENRDLTLARALVAECDKTLSELALGYETIAQTLYEGQVHNSIDRTSLVGLERFFNITVGILKIKSKSIAYTYVAKERVQRHKQVFDTFNSVIENSSKDLMETVKTVVKMGEENVLKPEVVQKVDKNLDEITKVLVAASEHKAKRNDSVTTVLKIVDEHLESYKEALKSYNPIDATDEYDFIEPEVFKDHPKQKKLKPNDFSG